ncbi:MAG TPA: sigma-70 family RNA polymerase sigma factor [Bacteroidota bacterium]|nr:sigma-70 family RNA polymerase sigma factor [Bacteroidota bacterium]
MSKQNNDLENKVWDLLANQTTSRNAAREAAKILHEYVIPKMMGLLVKRGADRITAEEVCKEAVDRAITLIRRFDPKKAKLSTWMTRIALNIFRDKYRKHLIPASRVESLNEFPEQERGDVPTSGESIIEDDPQEESAFIGLVRKVFPSLSKEEQDLVNYFIQDLPKEKYMESYSISDDLYRQRKLRTFEKLRLLLTPLMRGREERSPKS